jgi:hypothetical protein
VNELLARAGALFLAPAPAPVRPAVLPAADLVGVLAVAPSLDAVAGAVAAGLHRRHRVRTALVCRPGPVTARPASPAARALARRLAARDVPAVAAGVLCWVALQDDDVAGAWRAIGGAAGVPAVIALPARSEAWDALLADADQLVLATTPDADPAYGELALASLARLGPPCARVTAPTGFAARRLGAAGLSRLEPLPEGVPA